MKPTLIAAGISYPSFNVAYQVGMSARLDRDQLTTLLTRSDLRQAE
jgi:hypothetical protein